MIFSLLFSVKSNYYFYSLFERSCKDLQRSFTFKVLLSSLKIFGHLLEIPPPLGEIQENMLKSTKKLFYGIFHLLFACWKKKTHVSLSSLTIVFKFARSKINMQQLEEHDPGMIKKLLQCTAWYDPFVSLAKKVLWLLGKKCILIFLHVHQLVSQKP